MKEKWDRWRSFGCCGKCGEPCKPYAMCRTHRLLQAKIDKKYRDKNREELRRKERVRYYKKLKLKKANEDRKARP